METKHREFMSTSEAADFLGLSTRALEVWRHQKSGPTYVKMGSRVAYRITDLRAWTDANVVMAADAR